MPTILDFNAKPDSETLNTEAIQRAIDFCAQEGGGTVVVPAGTYKTGTVYLRSNVRIHLQAGAVIKGSTCTDDYIEESPGMAALICARDCSNIAITGSGIVDGCGRFFWDEYRVWKMKQGTNGDPAREGIIQPLRPRAVMFNRCTEIRLKDIGIRNSAMWTTHFLLCENVSVDSISVVNPPDSINTDGINPESCRNVRITNCYIATGDDCITLKAGYENSNYGPCENIVISNCITGHGHCGVGIGSEMSGGVRHVSVSNCIFNRTYRGVRLKTRRGRGGCAEHIAVNNCVMNNVLFPFFIDMFYYDSEKEDHVPVSISTPCFRHIVVHDCILDKAYKPVHIRGLPEMPVADVSFRNMLLSGEKSMVCKNAESVSFQNSRVHLSGWNKCLVYENVKGLAVDESIAAVEGAVADDEGQYTNAELLEKLK
ncbi:MAG: glycoside hydrolase family 28 protein [Chitinivibrionales bacterium]|nr:glycoside hydrolase family 28 protein [Chitinivibrionales bacterium]